MLSLSKIKEPVSEELKEFEAFFRKTAQSDITLLNIVVNYLLRSKGKQIRPIFVFLAAKMHGEISRSTYVAATTIELLHSASLIHDDVVDESYERRGFFSINALWKNKIAVLVGDYLLAKGLLISTKEKEYENLEIISTAVKDMVEGELLQFKKSRKLDIDEDTYFDIIKKKTASLIGTSMAVGAHSATRDPAVTEVMREVGILAGLAFQIRDDIFDYQEKGIIGKPIGNDIKEKKITLPLIYVLNNSTEAEKRKILKVISRKPQKKSNVEKLISLVVERGGIEYAQDKMNSLCEEAIKKLEQFPKNEASVALCELIRYVTNRKK
jgi:octaprenyl-diphosphate synthase